MWVRVQVTGGFVGPAGWEDHHLDLDKLPAETKAEVTKAVVAVGLDKGPAAPVPKEPPPPVADGKQYTFTVTGPNGTADLTVSQGALTPELKAVLTAMRAAAGHK